LEKFIASFRVKRGEESPFPFYGFSLEVGTKYLKFMRSKSDETFDIRMEIDKNSFGDVPRKQKQKRSSVIIVRKNHRGNE
jgi:hypothetical protein